MADDWRITIELPSEDEARELAKWLHDLEVDSATRSRLAGRIAVSRDDSEIFLYTDDEAPAREAARMVLARLGHPTAGTVELTRWHPVEQRWEDADVPLPATPEEWEAERERRQDREAAESEETGYAEWEVRVGFPTHEETEAFASVLEGEGSPFVRRHTFVLVGAATEDDARELAERLRAEAPDAKVEVEPGGEMVWQVLPGNPFAVFGGLGI